LSSEYRVRDGLEGRRMRRRRRGELEERKEKQ
jgi:hypothetical protein